VSPARGPPFSKVASCAAGSESALMALAREPKCSPRSQPCTRQVGPNCFPYARRRAEVPVPARTWFSRRFFVTFAYRLNLE
jgi:hypothetical protein